MGGAYSTNGGEVEKFLVGILKQRDHLEDLGLDVKKECFLKKSGWRGGGGGLGRGGHGRGERGGFLE